MDMSVPRWIVAMDCGRSGDGRDAVALSCGTSNGDRENQD
jgi:hypothetical protein